MSLGNPLPWFLIAALCLLVCRLLSSASPFYRARLEEAGGGRFESIDGLRGFLALGVLGVHGADMWALRVLGDWNAPEPHFYRVAGHAGVSLFFMITGFLFWLRVLRSGERLETRALYASRVRRLVPMYAVSVLMALAVVAALSGFSPHHPPAALARELRAWLSFGFMHNGPVNGVEEAHSVNAVYWTLAYEWLYYALLPLLALLARGRWTILVVAATLAYGSQAPVVFNFLFGAVGALAVHRRWLNGLLAAPQCTPLALASLGAVFLLESGYGLAAAGLLFVFFLCVVDGNSIFGMLRARSAKVFGLVSYSFYLTHCIVLFVVVRAAHAVAPISSLSIAQYWAIVGVAAILTALLSAFTFKYVEYPFLSARPVRPAPVVPIAQAA